MDASADLRSFVLTQMLSISFRQAASKAGMEEASAASRTFCESAVTP